MSQVNQGSIRPLITQSWGTGGKAASAWDLNRQRRVESRTLPTELARAPHTFVWLLAPNPKGLGAYNLGSIRTSVRSYTDVALRPAGRPFGSTYVRTSVDSDFLEVYGSNSLELYTKIRYGLRIMHVK